MGKRKERVKEIFRDKDLPEQKHYSKGRAAVILSVISVITCVLSIVGFLWIQSNFEDNNVLKDWVTEHPVIGSLVMIAICAVQVIVAFIPGELVEVACGVIFGAIGGTVICLAGILLGSTVAILLARRFGRRLVESLYPKDKLDSLPILHDPSKRNAMTAILFLIPGTPKDLLTYIIGLTDMSIPLYLLLASVCRLPSVVMSTVGGDALGDNRWLHAVYIFVIAAAVSGLGYLIYSVIHKRQSKKKDENKK
ncbi:MAG: TVP38/TMEM64 family protein [Clostridia bacterium]|nr:TVP38/TMEM64 family protein [Clostridia bacterium]